MKKLLIAICCCTLFSSLSFAQASVSFGLQANAASISVSGPLKDVYGAGYGGGAHLDIKLPMLSFRVAGDYISFSPDNDKYRALLAGLTGNAATDFSLDGGRISILSVTINTKMGLPFPLISPYLTAGVGTATLSSSDATVMLMGQPYGSVPGVKSQTKFSFNAGAGVDLNLSVVTLYLEAKYTWIFTDDGTSTYVPVSLGVTF